MHPDLSPHLHSDECNEIIGAYHKCHNEHPFKKFIGYCNELDRAMNRCLRNEYAQKRKSNKGSRRNLKSTQ